jgi:hypothetical protein
MGLLGLLGLGGKGERHLVVITFEGPGRLRLNGNRSAGKRAKKGAAAHDQTVAWIEFAPEGGRLDQGLGPAAARMGVEEVQALLRDLPTDPACRAVLQGLAGGREHSSKVLDFSKWGQFGVGRGPSASGERSAG